MKPAVMRSLRRGQEGMVLFVALIVLVAMTLAGIALMRSVDTNVLIAGNLAFRQGATMAGDWGVEAARTWISANTAGTGLQEDQVGSSIAYYSTWQSNLDLIGTRPSTPQFDWQNTSRLLGTDAGGNEVRYVIHRLCGGSGPPDSASANCVKASAGAGASGAAGGTKGVVAYGVAPLPGISSTYYRVTVKISGPRNTVSFVQAILN